MKNRAHLLEELKKFKPFNATEADHIARSIAFIEQTEEAFERVHHTGGHVTGSMYVVDESFEHVLLNHHATYNKWLTFGGHCDGEEDALAVACRELLEEAGIDNFECSGELFDVDIHTLSPHEKRGAQIPQHRHYDMMYLAVVPLDIEFIKSDESVQLKWMALEEALEISQKPYNSHLERMVHKTMALRDEVRLAQTG